MRQMGERETKRSLAALVFRAGKWLQPRLEELPAAQAKLLCLYVDRVKEQRTAGAGAGAGGGVNGVAGEE